MYIDIGGIIDYDIPGNSTLETTIFKQVVESVQNLIFQKNRSIFKDQLICILSRKPGCENAFIIYLMGNFSDSEEDVLFISNVFRLLTEILKRYFPQTKDIECYGYRFGSLTITGSR